MTNRISRTRALPIISIIYKSGDMLYHEWRFDIPGFAAVIDILNKCNAVTRNPQYMNLHNRPLRFPKLPKCELSIHDIILRTIDHLNMQSITV